MRFNTSSSPHTQKPTSVTQTMLHVLYALIPGICLYIWFFGWGVLINICLASVAALIVEAFMLSLRDRPIKPFILDGSAVVTAFLLALAIPPTLPWWMTVVGISFAIVFAKHVYGGLGNNIFNPAMVGYVLLLISFPKEMTTWLPPETGFTFMQSVSLIFLEHIPGINIDAISEATPMDTLKTLTDLGSSVAEVQTQLGLDEAISEALSINPVFGHVGGIGWEWVNLGYLIGGAWLIYKKVIRWHIPLAVLLSITLISAIFNFVDPNNYASPAFHLLTGATLLGAFFIATDPVTAAASLKGKIIFGVSIGIITYIIRAIGGYPDGFAFAVLLMNMVVPTIDYYLKPTVFGHGKK